MKKNLLFGIALLAITLCFTGCPNLNGGNGDGIKTVSVKNADVLFITNPTHNQQKNNESWIKMNVSPTVRSTAEAIAAKEPSARSGKTTEGKTFYEIGERHIFKGKDGFIDPNNKACEGSVRYIGEHCYLWTLIDEANGDNENLKYTDEELKFIADKFDSLYEKETTLIGLPYQGISKFEGIINPCDKVSILLCDMGKDEYGKWTGAFISGAYYKKEVPDEDQIELITIDTWYLKKDMNSMFTTIAHEFNHLLNFVNKYLVKGLDYDSWYTEMLSMLVEDYCIADYNINVTSSVQQRIPTFAGGSYTYGFGNWRNEDSNVGKAYANAYAFGAYLVRNYGGAELIHEIATNNYVNEESVEKAVYKVTGKKYTFKELFNNFPKVLINPKNEIKDLPSLYKTPEKNKLIIGGKEYIYNFNAIDFDDFVSEKNPKIIKPKEPIMLQVETLNSYGFWFFRFDEKTDMSITLKNYLCYDSYSF